MNFMFYVFLFFCFSVFLSVVLVVEQVFVFVCVSNFVLFELNCVFVTFSLYVCVFMCLFSLLCSFNNGKECTKQPLRCLDHNISEYDSLTVSAVAWHAADPGLNPGEGKTNYQFVLVSRSVFWATDLQDEKRLRED